MPAVPNALKQFEIPKTWWLRAIAVAAVLGALAVSAPLIALAVTAGAGLLTLAGMALVGFVALQALPLGMQKLENHLL